MSFHCSGRQISGFCAVQLPVGRARHLYFLPDCLSQAWSTGAGVSAQGVATKFAQHKSLGSFFAKRFRARLGRCGHRSGNREIRIKFLSRPLKLRSWKPDLQPPNFAIALS